jgi:hypothetical protein
VRVLIVHRYFWPDTPPYASILRSIAGRWAEDGHEVTVLTSQPSYTAGQDARPRREHVDGFEVRRVRLLTETKTNVIARVINVVLFTVSAMMRVERGRYDVVMAATTPPVVLAAGSLPQADGGVPASSTTHLSSCAVPYDSSTAPSTISSPAPASGPPHETCLSLSNRGAKEP